MGKAEIQNALLDEIARGQLSPSALVATRFGMARQTVSKYLNELVGSNVLTKTGRGKSVKYQLVENTKGATFKLGVDVDEDTIWSELSAGVLDDLAENERRICHYGFTEMANNAIDHSEGSTLEVTIRKSARRVAMLVIDNGIGIFQKISKALQLVDHRQALLELSKGKFTTDPSRHTGEGIFFTSRMFDRFMMLSETLALIHSVSGDWLIEDKDSELNGTNVIMTLNIPSRRTITEVFDEYSSGPDDHRFAKTKVPLNLAQIGQDELVSRSQARRVLARVDRFTEVILDFAGVTYVGQAFADEIFRVFKLQNPEVQLDYVNANIEVQKMILRALKHESR
jgi:anti-sigma regulatory factor (Ser/Thr protein kinase)